MMNKLKILKVEDNNLYKIIYYEDNNGNTFMKLVKKYTNIKDVLNNIDKEKSKSKLNKKKNRK